MNIYVVPRNYIEKQIEKDINWINEKWIISIFSSFYPNYSPIPIDKSNVLKLQFDDVSEKDMDSRGVEKYDLIFFNQDHAKQIHNFIKNINDNGIKPFYIHCDAGVSRSGAVGYMLNEWFNKFINLNRNDNESFIMNNPYIMPNPLVVRLLKNEFFGTDYKGVFINDYTFNEDGERIDHIKEV